VAADSQAGISVVATWGLAAASQPTTVAFMFAAVAASDAASAAATGAITAMTGPTITMATATAATRLRWR
jgi:hypothetical protein